MENKEIESSMIQKLLYSLEVSKRNLISGKSIPSSNNRDEILQEYTTLENITKKIKLDFSSYRKLLEEDQIVSKLLRKFEQTFENNPEIKVATEDLRKTFLSKQEVRKKSLNEKMNISIENLKNYAKKYHYHTLYNAVLDDKYIDNMVRQNKSSIDYDVVNSANYKVPGFFEKIKTTADKQLEDFNKYKVTSSKQNLSQKLFNPMSLQIKKVEGLLEENAKINNTIAALNQLEKVIKQASYQGLSLTTANLLLEKLESIRNNLYKRSSEIEIELRKIDAYKLAKENQESQVKQQRRESVIAGYKDLYIKLLTLNENVYKNAQQIDEIKVKLDDYVLGNNMTAEEINDAKIAALKEYNKHEKTNFNDKQVETPKNNDLQSNQQPNTFAKTKVNPLEKSFTVSSAKTAYNFFQNYANLLENPNMKYDIENYFKDYIKICKEQKASPSIDSFAKHLISAKGMNNLPADLKEQVYASEVENLKKAGFSEVIPDYVSAKTVSEEPLNEEEKRNIDYENDQKWFDMQVEQARLKIENVSKNLSKQLGIFNSEYYYQIIMEYINVNYANLKFEDLVNNMFMIFKEYGLNIDSNELMKALESAKANYLMIELKANFSNITHSEEEIQKFLKSLTGSLNNNLKR